MDNWARREHRLGRPPAVQRNSAILLAVIWKERAIWATYRTPIAGDCFICRAIFSCWAKYRPLDAVQVSWIKCKGRWWVGAGLPCGVRIFRAPMHVGPSPPSKAVPSPPGHTMSRPANSNVPHVTKTLTLICCLAAQGALDRTRTPTHHRNSDLSIVQGRR